MNVKDDELSEGNAPFKQTDEDLDSVLALSLMTAYSRVKENIHDNSQKCAVNNSEASKPLSIVDEQWELIDPHPDIHALFIQYNKKYFYEKLEGVEVKWSSRMTLCAGLCRYERRGGLCSISLSVPLLKLRPRKDLVETLLHEMIHAYLFVTHNNKDRDDHGPEFKSHMNRINKDTGTRITVYHTFHDEVELYKTHWWKCDGPCQKRHPFYGYVKRSMNRAPGPNDNWWNHHQASCGGTFTKVKEPDNYKKKTSKKAISPVPGSSAPQKNIRSFFNRNLESTSKGSATSKQPAAESSTSSGSKFLFSNEKNVVPIKKSETWTNFIPFQGTGHRLGSSSQPFYKTARVGDSTNKKRPLPSSSFEKTPEGKQLSNITKFLKIPSSDGGRYPHKNQQLSTQSVTPSSARKSLTQSSLENFLSPKTTAGGSSSGSLHTDINSMDSLPVDALKVTCPICFIPVKEQDINSHLDKCLLKKE